MAITQSAWPIGAVIYCGICTTTSDIQAGSGYDIHVNESLTEIHVAASCPVCGSVYEATKPVIETKSPVFTYAAKQANIAPDPVPVEPANGDTPATDAETVTTDAPEVKAEVPGS